MYNSEAMWLVQYVLRLAKRDMFWCLSSETTGSLVLLKSVYTRLRLLLLLLRDGNWSHMWMLLCTDRVFSSMPGLLNS